jgi:hypothetical protein
MKPEPTDPAFDGGGPPRRLFLHEPGWRVGMKVGSEREFCYAMAPQQDHYHRLQDGEIFLQHGVERLCLACAERRGLLSYRPRSLRESLGPIDLDDTVLEVPVIDDPPPGPR